jgi:ethanolamine permease
MKKTLKMRHIWAIAVGMVISGQFFGWNYGFRVAGIEGMFIASAIVTLFYFCFMLSYAELAAMIPKAGGPSAYAERAFGPRGGFAAGIACLIEFVFAPPAIAVATGAYIHFLWPVIPASIAGVSAFALCLLINLTSSKDVALFELIVTLLAIVALVIFYSSNLAKPLHQSVVFSSSATENWPAAIPFAIWLYLAIEGVAMTAEEVIKPHKDIPRGFILAIVTIGICSTLTLLFTALHCHDPRAAIDYPLSHTLAELYGQKSWIARSVDVLGLFGLLASLNGIIIGYSRQVFALARAKHLPAFFCRETKNGAPIWALLIPGIFGIICAGSADISNSLIIVAAFGAVCMYCIALASLFRLRHIEATTYRPYRVFYPWIPGLGLLLGLFCVGCVVCYALIPNTIQLFDWKLNLALFVCCVLVLSFFTKLLPNKKLKPH